MTNDKLQISEVRKIGKELESAFLETCQHRTDYQLDTLNVKSHETPQRQYKQCLDELIRTVSGIGELEINVEELEDDIQQAELAEAAAETDYERRKADRQRRKKELALWQTRFAIEGQLREFATLYKIYQQSPKFTAAEIQAAEAEYYRLRKFKQAALQLESAGRIDPELMNLFVTAGYVENDYAQGFEKLLNSAAEKKQLTEKR